MIYVEEKWPKQLFKRFGVSRGCLIIIGITWVPLVLFSLVVGERPDLDIATHVRLLITLPVFLLSYPVVVRKFNWILNHFNDAELLDQEEQRKLRHVIHSIERVVLSPISKSILLLLSYALIFYIYYFVTADHLSWRKIGRPAGWWFNFISFPLFLYVLLSFLFRLIMWWRLVFNLSVLKLRLRPAHGDGFGGLGFLSTILNALALPAFAFSASAAAGAANLIILNELQLDGLKALFVGFTVVLFLLLAGPLTLFFPILLRSREKSIYDYGVMDMQQMKDFQVKWLDRPHIEQNKLESPDFSAVTDLGSEVARVHSMKLVPIKLVDVVILITSICLPFLPVFSLKLPWNVIFGNMFNLLH